MGRICREYKTRMKNELIEYIQECITCSIAKLGNCKLGLCLPLPIPDKPWHSISIDFMSSLPTTKHGHEIVYVVVDIFSKMAILVAYIKAISVEEFAKKNYEHV